MLKPTFFEPVLKRKSPATSFQNGRLSFCIKEAQVLTTCTSYGILIQLRSRRLIGRVMYSWWRAASLCP